MIPYIKSNKILGFANEFQKAPFDLISELYNKHGSIFQFRIGPYKPIIILNNELISHIMKNYSNYPKSYLYNEMKLIMGNGLITNNSPGWKNQRQKIQPIFHSKMFEKYQNKIEKISIDSINLIKTQNHINIENWLSELSLNIILNIILNIQTKSKENKQFLKDINIIIDFFKSRVGAILKVPMILPTKNNIKFKFAFKRFKQKINQLIQISLNDNSYSILNQLINTSSKSMDSNQLMDEIITLILAGHETISHSLVWTIYLLSENKEIETKLIKSINDQSNNNSFIINVINESLRLMPPVPFLTRNVINSETINGYKLNHDSLIIIPIYNYHRLNSNWKKPNIFSPDRWINNNKQNDIFIPFGSGPKQCIGNRLSYLEMEIILSEIYKNIKLIKLNNNIISTNPFITLRPNEDIIMKIETVH